MLKDIKEKIKTTSKNEKKSFKKLREIEETFGLDSTPYLYYQKMWLKSLEEAVEVMEKLWLFETKYIK